MEFIVQDDLEQEQQLEQLLEKAFDDPALRPQFLALLLNSDIYFLGSSSNDVDIHVEHTLSEGSQIQIKSWNKADGTEILPFFTSLEKLQKAIQDPESYLKIHTQSFFELTLGATLALNPNSGYGKEFTAEEIQGLLSSDFENSAQPYEYEENTQVLMSQPQPYPLAMAENLNRFLVSHREVTSAYLAQIHDTQRDPEPTLVIGLLIDQLIEEKQLQALKGKVGNMVVDNLENKKPIDLFIIDSNDKEGLSHYLLMETKPFYVRQEEKKKGFFARLFS